MRIVRCPTVCEMACRGPQSSYKFATHPSILCLIFTCIIGFTGEKAISTPFPCSVFIPSTRPFAAFGKDLSGTSRIGAQDISSLIIPCVFFFLVFTFVFLLLSCYNKQFSPAPFLIIRVISPSPFPIFTFARMYVVIPQDVEEIQTCYPSQSTCMIRDWPIN